MTSRPYSPSCRTAFIRSGIAGGLAGELDAYLGAMRFSSKTLHVAVNGTLREIQKSGDRPGITLTSKRPPRPYLTGEGSRR